MLLICEENTLEIDVEKFWKYVLKFEPTEYTATTVVPFSALKITLSVEKVIWSVIEFKNRNPENTNISLNNDLSNPKYLYIFPLL